ncbi:zinc finger protein [Canna indica]|uniref:Zinc finger protein n=1 Tax=Canna indica TaxID=4628 RepID=A0AAQ3JV20_9LILI|nr:zinc finger protein [Canna indica]
MDQRKALFRSKLREAQKREKRIDSPLVRYNENDQPVCKVCNVVLKSESHWPAHQVSKKHHEAIEKLKSSAAGVSRDNKLGTEQPKEHQNPRSSSTLPADFFDNQNAKRQKIDMVVGGQTQGISVPASSVFSYNQLGKKNLSPSISQPSNAPESLTKFGQSSEMVDATDEQVVGALPQIFFDKAEDQTFKQSSQQAEDKNAFKLKQVDRALNGSNQTGEALKEMDGSEAKQVKGALPEGFFDNKDADLRARGIEPVKVDINDAYKEFEKEIQVNLQDVDDRLEEEEIDAAEVMEGFRSLEQKEYKERVDEIKRKLMEAKGERLARAQRPAFMGKESSDDSSSDDGDDNEDDDDNFAVDWRAQHL